MTNSSAVPKQEESTPYDALAYPTAIFNQTQPDRLATLARLCGLNPPPIETAHVLEIGAGDGMNLLALAVAYPHARFTGFDLAPTAVARGRRWIAESGVGNMTLTALDILDAAEVLEGEFDYIIAHGVYAWVPPVVREATMALVGRKLSPDGVAFVSYNAMPGGFIRLALRDALLFALEGVADEDREEIARAHLRALAEAPEGTREPVAGRIPRCRRSHGRQSVAGAEPRRVGTVFLSAIGERRRACCRR